MISKTKQIILVGIFSVVTSVNAGSVKSSDTLTTDAARRLAEMTQGKRITCSPQNTKDADHLHFSFQTKKQENGDVGVDIVTKSEKDPIWFGGDGVIDLSVGDEFSYIAAGDDGRRLIVFETPGVGFESWSSTQHGICDDATVSTAWSGHFANLETVECCVK